MASYKNNYGKYYCKYCDLTLANNVASITRHEQGNRHKRNVQKFLRQLRAKKGEDDRETFLELRRIEAATGLKLLNRGGASDHNASSKPPSQPQSKEIPVLPVPEDFVPEDLEKDEEDDYLDGETYDDRMVRRGEAAPMPGEWSIVEETPVNNPEDIQNQGEKVPEGGNDDDDDD